MLKLLKQARTAHGAFSSLLLDRACFNPAKAQRAFLLALIKQNAATSFGRAHGFNRLSTESDFRAVVPVREYEDFRPFINRIIAGEPNVLTRQEPLMLTMTSGTTSEPKFIPVTRSLQNQTASLMSEWLARAERDH